MRPIREIRDKIMVQRYSVDFPGQSVDENPNGDYVLYKDYSTDLSDQTLFMAWYVRQMQEIEKVVSRFGAYVHIVFGTSNGAPCFYGRIKMCHNGKAVDLSCMSLDEWLGVNTWKKFLYQMQDYITLESGLSCQAYEFGPGNTIYTALRFWAQENLIPWCHPVPENW